MKKLLLLKAGNAQPALVLRTGDYERWFIDSLGLQRLRVDIVYANLGQRLPARARDYDAVMMTGSPLSMTTPLPWMLQAGEWMLEAAAQRVPVLGVCFGHQLLGHMLGVRVIRNPRGRETGTVEVTLTREGMADPLFEGLGLRLWVNATHEDVLTRIPPDADLLAYNPNSPVQAMGVGRYLRGVQFHPELSPAGMRALLELRRPKLEAEAMAQRQHPGHHMRALLARVHPFAVGKEILRNFLSRF